MKEILPGVWHWTTEHESWKIPIQSCFLPDLGGGVLIDPRVPDEGLDWFREHGEPAHAILTNRHHYRHSGKFRAAFGTVIHCHSAGMHEFTKGEEVEAFEHGETLPGGIEALEVGVLCPEETAALIPLEGGILALGDGVIRYGGELRFVSDEHLGDDPPAVKRGLRASLARHLGRDFRHLIFAHGEPITGEGKKRLRAFVETA